MSVTERIRESEQPGFNQGYRLGSADRAALQAVNADLEAANTQLRNEIRALKARIRRLTKDAT